MTTLVIVPAGTISKRTIFVDPPDPPCVTHKNNVCCRRDARNKKRRGALFRQRGSECRSSLSITRINHWADADDVRLHKSNCGVNTVTLRFSRRSRIHSADCLSQSEARMMMMMRVFMLLSHVSHWNMRARVTFFASFVQDTYASSPMTLLLCT